MLYMLYIYESYDYKIIKKKNIKSWTRARVHLFQVLSSKGSFPLPKHSPATAPWELWGSSGGLTSSFKIYSFH